MRLTQAGKVSTARRLVRAYINIFSLSQGLGSVAHLPVWFPGLASDVLPQVHDGSGTF
jgi:hypothetical protein